MTPRPCPCTICVGGCRQTIAQRAPWTVCKACYQRRHRPAPSTEAHKP